MLVTVIVDFLKGVRGVRKGGEEVEVLFRQSVNLGSGDYLVSFGFTRFEGNRIQVIHRRYDAMQLKVLNTDGSFGISNCFSQITCNTIREA